MKAAVQTPDGTAWVDPDEVAAIVPKASFAEIVTKGGVVIYCAGSVLEVQQQLAVPGQEALAVSERILDALTGKYPR